MPGTLVGAGESAESGVDKHVYFCGAYLLVRTDRQIMCSVGTGVLKEGVNQSKGVRSDGSLGVCRCIQDGQKRLF